MFPDVAVIFFEIHVGFPEAEVGTPEPKECALILRRCSLHTMHHNVKPVPRDSNL